MPIDEWARIFGPPLTLSPCLPAVLAEKKVFGFSFQPVKTSLGGDTM